MTRGNIPAADVEFSVELVRGLLEDQHPDLAHLPLTEVGNGWDNALFRLGDSLVVRLPRRTIAAELAANEQRWLPQLAPALPLQVPVVNRIGEPGRGYPWRWSICRWIDDAPASSVWPLADTGSAEALGAFVKALHTPTPPDAPINPFRGVPLAARTERVLQYIAALGSMIPAARVIACWHVLVAARPWSGPPVWVHGDLHPGNVIVANGRIAAVIDFGDLTAGDPATDLAAAWMVFAPSVRDVFRRAAVSPGQLEDPDLWNRARGWALALNLAWLTAAANDEETTRLSLATIDAVLAETP